jgi:uncharacterized protein YecE (DUF72 family)
MLGYYAKQFHTVEVNNTFYQLPGPSTVDSWRDNSPRNFVFAIKGSRFITHMKKLKDAKSSSVKFFAAVDRLDRKLGPILFQLPPRWRVNLDRLANFLDELPKGHRYAFEFRDNTWMIPEMFDLLHSRNAAFCIYDLGNTQSPLEVTADFVYLRFHGPGEAKYKGSYSAEALREWARRISDWQTKLSAIFVYFNNDVEACAVQNATQLKQLIKRYLG